MQPQEVLVGQELAVRTAFRSGKRIDIRKVPLRPLRQGELRLKVEACGICGTDLHSDPQNQPQDARFGHEMAGTILELGSETPGLEVGQKVVIESATPCGRCANCRNTQQELCTDIQSFFYLDHFGFADQTIVPAISAIPCNGLAPEIASLSEPLGVAIDLVRLADIKTTSNVLVLGLGPIGLMAIALAKQAGARRVFASDFYNRTARITLAKVFGADYVINRGEMQLDKFDYGCGIDRVLVTAPPASLADAFKVAVKGAIVSFIGIGYGNDAFCRFDANEFHFKKLQLRASFASPALYTPLALQYLQEGVIDGEALISHRFPLEQINEAMSVAANDPSSVKVMIVSR